MKNADVHSGLEVREHQQSVGGLSYVNFPGEDLEYQDALIYACIDSVIFPQDVVA